MIQPGKETKWQGVILDSKRVGCASQRFFVVRGRFPNRYFTTGEKVAEGSDPSVGKRRWILFGPRAHPIMHDTILNAATV
jgi:hypothetical protein